MSILIVLLILWAALAVLGLVIKGLFWLFVLAAAAFAITGIWGLIVR